MKKTYIKPLFEAYTVSNESILAASPGFKSGTVLSGDAKSGSLSWDDDFEDAEE